MNSSMYFWISVVSFIVNVLLTMAGIGLWVANNKEKDRRNAQVKIWMQDANGLTQALVRIIQDKWNGLYSSVQDVVNAVNAVHASAFALYQSLYEERTITEDEWKTQQAALRAQLLNQNNRESANISASDQLGKQIIQTGGGHKSRLRRLTDRFKRKKN